jgi:beta-glucanase (GH16 family)
MTTKLVSIGLILMFLSCSKSGSSNTQTPADPQLNIADVSMPEGNSGFTPFQFTISLDHASSKTVTVAVTTVEGTAKNNEDFTPITSQVVAFQPNETSKTVTINVVGDNIEESDEQFKMVLSNPTNATIGQGTATATIINDDTKVTFTNSGYDAPTSYPGYSLVWSDEFNGTSLDQNVWSFETGNGSGGWGNNELEYYTSRPNNLTFQDGKLIIHALKESYAGSSYTSARIKTQGKKEFKFGRIDIRAILPQGKGIWPALWMLGSNIGSVGWPSCGEIDIMELLGQDPSKVYGTMHFNTSTGHAQNGGSYITPSGSFSDAFHVFSIEWKQDQIKMYVDNNLYHTLNATDIGAANYPFNQPFFFIFNVAVGGNWPGNPDASTNFPQWMIVDYVRVYQ